MSRIYKARNFNKEWQIQNTTLPLSYRQSGNRKKPDCSFTTVKKGVNITVFHCDL